MTNPSRWTRLLLQLKPDADSRRYLPYFAFPLFVLIVILVTTTNHFYECDHYPDISTAKSGGRHYRCNSPSWELTCYHGIKGPTTDACLRSWGPGANFINHFKAFRDSDCQAKLGPQARVTGSKGCECTSILNQEGQCVSAERYCSSMYGKHAFPAVVTQPAGTIETFISRVDPEHEENSIFGVCRCPDGFHFDTQISQCLADSAG